MGKKAQFPREQYLVLQALAKKKQPATFDELVNELDLDQVFVSSAVQTLAAQGLVEMYEESYQELRPGKGAEPFLKAGRLPETIIAEALEQCGGSAHISELPAKTGLEQKHVGKNIKVLLEKQWITREGPRLTLTDTGKAALGAPAEDEQRFIQLVEKGMLAIGDGGGAMLPAADPGLQALLGRSQLVTVKERTNRSAALTEKGRNTVDAGIRELIEVTQLTPELLHEGAWRHVEFKPYNVADEAAPSYPGKIHPYQRLLNETRHVYLQMGFTEIESPHVESAFWDFDALFQPQDHPARDMQDTFYVGRPEQASLPDKKITDQVQAVHENGGDTGSLGWGYRWNGDLARKLVLRTHTTAASIRQLARTPEPPLKVFCIGRVFRRETVDYKHLPAFMQVDGIVVDPDMSLAHLIGMIREFFRKMGFDKIEVKPDFFPYTEPSLEVSVYLEEKQDWVEMGGAGIFRKEVTEPMGCKHPVLAWGLGLERLAMFRYGITDIRDIYMANIQWLREVPSCRL